MSELLGVPVPVGKDRLELKTSGSMIVAQATAKRLSGFQLWLVIFETTYQQSAALPQPIPPDEKWCLTCGFCLSLCECEKRIFLPTPTVNNTNTGDPHLDPAASDESWLL